MIGYLACTFPILFAADIGPFSYLCVTPILIQLPGLDKGFIHPLWEDLRPI
jgi:hypothetical protein